MTRERPSDQKCSACLGYRGVELYTEGGSVRARPCPCTGNHDPNSNRWSDDFIDVQMVLRAGLEATPNRPATRITQVRRWSAAYEAWHPCHNVNRLKLPARSLRQNLGAELDACCDLVCFVQCHPGYGPVDYAIEYARKHAIDYDTESMPHDPADNPPCVVRGRDSFPAPLAGAALALAMKGVRVQIALQAEIVKNVRRYTDADARNWVKAAKEVAVLIVPDLANGPRALPPTQRDAVAHVLLARRDALRPTLIGTMAPFEGRGGFASRVGDGVMTALADHVFTDPTKPEPVMGPGVQQRLI